MNKTVFRLISVIATFALALGNFVNTQALSEPLVQNGHTTLKLSDSATHANTLAGAPAQQTKSTRMLIPLYSDPPSQWASVISANTYKNIDVIINPADGPGSSQQSNYLNGIAQLRSAGIGVLGYVYTGYGTRSLATVKAEVDTWKNWYGVDGIFFDEASNTTSSVPYYSELQTYVTTKAMTLILNPGTNTIESYASVANTNVIYENDPSSALTVSSWVAKYPAAKFAVLQYAANADQMRSLVPLAKSKNIGYIYVTDDVLPNPWNGLPAYLAEEATLLASGSFSPTVTSTPLPVTPTNTPTPTKIATLPSTVTAATAPTATLTKTATVIAPTPTLAPVTPTAVLGQNTVEVRVTNGMDDVEESSTGSMYTNSSDLELVYDGSNQVVGMRFNGVNVPKGATITNAYLQFKVDETSSEATNLAIQGELNSNASAFTQKTRNVSARLRTANAVSWSPTSWQTLGAAGADQRTPNMASVVQEIVNQTGWAAGNSLVMIITGSGHRVAEAYEVDPGGAPLLHIEYNVIATSTNTLIQESTNTPTPTESPTASPTIPATIVTPIPTNTPTPTPTISLTNNTPSPDVPAPALPTATETVTIPTVIVTASLEPASPTVTASPIPVEPAITLTSEPPTITAETPNKPASETIYDDKDSAFTYSAGWADVSKKQAYNASFKLTTQKDSFVTFAFTGQSFSILYKGGPTFRNMDLYVDDVLVGTINERTARSSFQQRWDYAGQLNSGTHILKLVFVTPNTSDITNGSIDAVIVR